MTFRAGVSDVSPMMMNRVSPDKFDRAHKVSANKMDHSNVLYSSKDDMHDEYLVDDTFKKEVKAKLYCKVHIDKNESFEEFNNIKNISSSKYKQ